MTLVATALSCGGTEKAPAPMFGATRPCDDRPPGPSLPSECQELARQKLAAQAAATPAPSAAPARVEAAADRLPEVFPPPYTRVGVGQTISFATTAIDQDLDITRTMITKLPPSARFDAITQTVTWTPTRADLPRGEFVLEISQPERAHTQQVTWTIEVADRPQVLPVAAPQSPVIETLLMIRQPRRLEEVNRAWPLDRMLLVGAEGFAPQFAPDKRAQLTGKLDKATLFNGFLTAFAQSQGNGRLDPASPQFDKTMFGDPAAWKIVAVRPRIDKAWAELRIVYQAIKAPEPVFAMFRIRPVVEYVPALPRPAEEKLANNKIFLGMVGKHLLPGRAPSAKLFADQAAHGKAVAAFVDELMAFNDDKTAPYLRTFAIGIAMEARLGGGSARNADGSYAHGDGWGWSAMKPFQTPEGTTQQYTNVIIPGFWTATAPTDDGTGWKPVCGPRWTAGTPAFAPGHDVLCRKPLGFVDLPDTSGDKVKGSRVDANHLFVEHKNRFMVADLALDDGRRDVGEENGMTCSQCHIRNFGMHDYADPANTDPRRGTPTGKNRPLATLNFQITPTTHWEAFTLEFLAHQECRGKAMFEQYLGPAAAPGLTCPLAPRAN